MDNPLSAIFGFVGTFYGLIVPLSLLVLVGLLMLISLQSPHTKPKDVGEAIYVYSMHGLSVLLMTIGALPTVFSVLAGMPFGNNVYVALLLVFAFGGLIFLLEDRAIRTLNTAAKEVIEAIYITTLRIIGNSLSLLSIISLLLLVVVQPDDPSQSPDWWVMPLVLFLYGLLMSWCTAQGNQWEMLKLVQKQQPKKSPLLMRKTSVKKKTSAKKSTKKPAKKRTTTKKR